MREFVPPDSSSENAAISSSIQIQPALARLGGDVSLLKELAVFYLEDCPMLLQAIEQGIAQKDCELIVRSAHSIKGLSSNFDAHAAVQAAWELEKCGRNQDVEAAGRRLVELQLQTETVIEALQRDVLRIPD